VGERLPPGSILGTRVQRTEDPGFLNRGAVYTEDLVDERLTGALHATFVRSPVAHARIVSIDTSAATTTAAPDVRRRPRRSSGPSTCSPPSWAWTRPTSAGAT
jgi:hypothetical protein